MDQLFKKSDQIEVVTIRTRRNFSGDNKVLTEFKNEY